MLYYVVHGGERQSYWREWLHNKPRLHIELEDRGRSFDPAGDPDPEQGGFGLQIVAALSDEWGIEDTDEGVRVWAIVPPDPPTHDA